MRAGSCHVASTHDSMATRSCKIHDHDADDVDAGGGGGCCDDDGCVYVFNYLLKY